MNEWMNEGSLARKLRFHIFIQLSLFQGSLARKLRCRILHFHFFLTEVSHDSFVLTSSTFTFWGTSRTTVSFSHLALSLFEGSLARELRFHLPLSLFEGSFARKLRFHIFHVHFLRKVSHEMRFWKFAGARNAVFCRRKCVPEDGWGNLSGWQVRNTFVSIGIMLGSADHWNWQFRRRFANVLVRTSIVVCNSAFANRIVMAASRLPGVEAVCVILLSFAAGHGKSHWCGCIKAAIVICQQNFSILALVIFRLKFLLKSASISSFFALASRSIRFWSWNFWRVCA